MACRRGEWGTSHSVIECSVLHLRVLELGPPLRLTRSCPQPRIQVSEELRPRHHILLEVLDGVAVGESLLEWRVALQNVQGSICPGDDRVDSVIARRYMVTACRQVECVSEQGAG